MADPISDAAEASPEGYGGDPNLVTPSRPWPLTLSAHDRKMLAVLSDIILPGTAAYPAPSQMGIAQFFDEWLSAPYSTQQGHRLVILNGLAQIEAMAHAESSGDFLRLAPAKQRQIVERLAATSNPERAFFIRLRYLVVAGYFTSDIGFKAIGYIGNVPRQGFPPVSASVRQVLEQRLKDLGL